MGALLTTHTKINPAWTAAVFTAASVYAPGKWLVDEVPDVTPFRGWYEAHAVAPRAGVPRFWNQPPAWDSITERGSQTPLSKPGAEAGVTHQLLLV